MRKRFGWVLIVISLFLIGCMGGGSTTFNVSGIIEPYEGGELPQDIEVVFQPGGIVRPSSDGSFAITGLKRSATVSLNLEEGWGSWPESIEVTRANSSTPLKFTVYDESKTNTGSVTVSFIADYHSIRPAVNSRPWHAFSQDIYRTELQNPGEKVDSFTPSRFLVNIQEMRIVHPNYSAALLFPPEVATGSHGGSPIPVHFDLTRSEEVIDATYLLNKELFDFEALQMICFTRDGSDRGWYDLPFLSEIHVDLGERYRDIVLANEMADKAYDTVHVFQMADLIPLENNWETEVMQLVFGEYVEEPFILNPDGSYLHYLDDHPWETGGNHGLGGYAIYLPGFELNFQDNVKNHIIFSWDLVDLIEIYDNGTEDPADDLITFRLDDPFPISLHLESITEPPEIEIEARSVAEVEHLDLRYYDLVNQEVVLRWINPSDEQYHTTHVVRKLGSAPEDIDDGDLVYSGNSPIFQDIGVERDQQYFYRVITESKAGILSEGLTVNVHTYVPPLGELTLFTVKNGYDVFEGDVVEMEVGERIAVYYRTDIEPYRIVVNWSLDEDLARLDDTIGEHASLLAETPGETILWARHYSGVEASLKIVIIE
ncbi:MAG: hypothetical protein GX971_02210 [Firmicutes bacterium]|nr:hypothetical protein [Bacillota bacterium]